MRDCYKGDVGRGAEKEGWGGGGGGWLSGFQVFFLCVQSIPPKLGVSKSECESLSRDRPLVFISCSSFFLMAACDSAFFTSHCFILIWWKLIEHILSTISSESNVTKAKPRRRLGFSLSLLRSTSITLPVPDFVQSLVKYSSTSASLAVLASPPTNIFRVREVASPFGTERFGSISQLSSSCRFTFKQSSTAWALSKVTNPNPREGPFFPSRIITQSTMVPHSEKYSFKDSSVVLRFRPPTKIFRNCSGSEDITFTSAFDSSLPVKNGGRHRQNVTNYGVTWLIN